MGVTIDIENVGDPALKAELRAIVEHTVGDRSGDWKVSLLGSRASPEWELRVQGPNAFERVYMLDSASGEHDPQVIRSLLTQLLSRA